MRNTFSPLRLSLPFSSRLAGSKARKARALPTRHEIRLLAFILVLFVAASQLISVFLPDRLTPFGPATDNNTDSWYILLINLVITLLIANGLRHGYRWAWWVEIVLLAIPVLVTVLIVVLFVVLVFVPDQDATFDDVPAIRGKRAALPRHLRTADSGSAIVQGAPPEQAKLATSTAHPETAKQLLRKWGGRHHFLDDDVAGQPAHDHRGWRELHRLRPARRRCRRAGRSGRAARKHCRPPSTTSSPCATRRHGPLHLLLHGPDGGGDHRPGLAECAGRRGQPDRPAPTGVQRQEVAGHPNRAEQGPKEGITFEMVSLAEQSWRLVGQVQHLSEEWLGDKKLPEMGFTLGGLDEALDPDVKVGLALDKDGVIQGVTSWMPVYGGDDKIVGWTLDLMRRVDGGFRATMEFLIASSCLYFKAEGAQFLSLSGAPLAKSGSEAGNETAVERFLDTLGSTLEPVYGFRSLHQFKSKFQPRLSPMYMAFRDEADLPRIGIAITRAYLPTAGVRDMLTVAKH